MTEVEATPTVARPYSEPILYRSSTVANVNFSQRLIEFVAAPYEEEAVVLWRGEAWRELFERGAWDGIEKRPNRIKANRDHDKSRLVGKIANWWPSRDEGLVGHARIAQTPLGDETLALANEDCLGVSVAYVAPARDVALVRAAQGNPGLRRVKKAFMDHLSFVSDPTWESAAVTAVRSQSQPVEAHEPVATPALDELRDWLASRNR